MSYFIEVNFPIILKKHLKAALDEYAKIESGTYVPVITTMLQKTYSQLNIIDEGDMEDFDDDIEVGDFEIDDNISNFGGAGANGGNRCIGGRWELKRRKQQLIKYSLRKSFRELHNHLS